MYGGEAGEVLELLNSLWTLVGYLMGMKNASPTSVNVTERLVRVFLTRVYDFVEAMRLKEDAKPSWLSSYNFVCLLNIPEQIKMLGPVRNRYKGGNRGEGFLRLVKHHVRGTSRPNWHQNLLTTLLQQRTISLVGCPEMEDEEEADDDSSCTSSESVERQLDLCSFKSYKSRAEVLALIAKGDEPLSVILVQEENEPGILVSYYQQKERFACRLALDSQQPSQINGVFYFKLVLDTTEDYPAVGLDTTMYAVLLPSPSKHLYTLMSNDWLVLNKEQKLVLHNCR